MCFRVSFHRPKIEPKDVRYLSIQSWAGEGAVNLFLVVLWVVPMRIQYSWNSRSDIPWPLSDTVILSVLNSILQSVASASYEFLTSSAKRDI